MPYRPYYDAEFASDIYQPYPYDQQPNHPYPQQNGIPQQQQTPYQQFAKPQQPLFWESIHTTNANEGTQQQQNSQQGNGFKAYFQDQDGQVDFDKMLSTVGQLANTYHQVSPIIKQFGTLIKNFK